MKYLTLFFFLLVVIQLPAQERAIASPMSEAETRLNPQSPAYDPAISFSLYLKEAGKGNKKAMNALGVLYSEGTGTTQDAKLAVAWFTKSAVAGYVSAWYNLGRMYKKGIGVEQNFQTAYYYFKKGSEAKSSASRYTEGYMLYKGLGCVQNYVNAVSLFKKAIPGGNISAMYMLGLCYRNGYGTPMNTDSARFWLSKAASLGYKAALDEMQSSKKENVDEALPVTIAETKSLAKRSVQKGVNRLSLTTAAVKQEVSGSYSGWVIRYDWSGKHIIGKLKLTVWLEVADSIVTGNWAEEDGASTFLTARLTDSCLSFQNTAYQRTEHYTRGQAVKFEFRQAHLQVQKIADSVLLSGNLQLWSTKLDEPEKPVFISLVKTKNLLSSALQAGNQLTANAVEDSTLTNLIVYPNPFQHSFSIDYTTHKESAVAYSITDVISGKVVYRQNPIRLSPGNHSSVITQPNLLPGTYVFRISYDKRTKAVLVIKK